MHQIYRFPGFTSIDDPQGVDWLPDLTTEVNLTTTALSRGSLKIYRDPDLLISQPLDLPSQRPLGLRLELHVTRLARTVDSIVSWRLGDQLIGSNRAQSEPEDFALYGGEDDLWDLPQDLDFSLPDLRLAIKLAPHPLYPCSVQPVFRLARLTVYYE